MPINFCVSGENGGTVKSIQVDAGTNLIKLQKLLGKHFGIVEPQSILCEANGKQLDGVADILEATGPVTVTINGQDVRDPPGPQGLPLLGSHCGVYPDHIGNHQRLFDQYGPVIKTTVMGRTVYHTNDPVISSHVFAETDFFTKDINKAHPLYGVKSPHAGVFLTNTDTDTWRKAHKFFVPAFSPKAINHYTPRMQATVEQSFTIFDELDRQGSAWNAYNYMLKLSSQLVGQLWLEEDFKHFENIDSPIHPIPLNIVKLLGLNKKVTTWGDWYQWLPFGDPKRLRDTFHLVGTLVGGVMKRAPRGEGDVPLQEAAMKTRNLTDYLLRATDMKGEKMEPEGRQPALVVALTAGFVTTSSLLSWLIYGLVAYEGTQQRIYQELIDNGMDENTVMTPEFIGRLTYLDKYVKETQRRHTTSFQPARTARTDIILPGGYKIPKGGVVIPALHHIHNNPALWDNPTQFDPDRWDTERVKTRHRATYMPFAMGPRMCVATNFVAREVKLFMAKLVFRYDFVREGNDPIEYDSMFQTVKPSNLYVNARKRDTASS
ncbi:hypothetical protein AAFC00_006092 [Neodothiora populina]